MEAPDSACESGAPAHELPGVNRLSLMCGTSIWVIVTIAFFVLSLIYDGILSFMNVDHSWNLIWYFMTTVTGGFVTTCIDFSGFVVGLSRVIQREASKKQGYASFQGVLLCLSLLAAIALFIHLADAGAIDWIKGQLSDRR